MSDITHPLSAFVNLLSTHPFWSATNQEFVIDITGLPSQVLKAKMPDIKPSLHYVGAWDDKTQERLIKGNSKGFDFYYRVNYHRVRSAKTVKGEDITNVLYVCLDFDFKLPAAAEYIMTQAGIRPWCIVQTSLDPRKFRHHQVLIAIDPADSQRLEDAQRVGRLAADTLGGDIVCDLPRILRFAGLKNWKGAERGENRGTSRLLELSRSGVAYKLDELERLLTLAKLNPTVIACKSASPKRRHVNPVSYENGYTRLFHLDYKEALKLVERGEVVAHEGERYAALCSFAGGIANDVGAGRLGVKDGHNALDKLVGGFEGGADERKVAGVHTFLDKAADQSRREIKERIAEHTNKALEKLTPLTYSSVAGNGTGSEFAVSKRRMLFFKGLLESESIDAEFVEQCFENLQVLKSNDGYVSPLAWLLLDRAKAERLIVEQFFCVPSLERTSWGAVRYRQETFTGDVEEGLLNELAERVYKLVLDKRELLEQCDSVREKLEDIERSVRRECTGADGVLNEVEYVREFNKAKVKFFTFKFTRIMRKYIAGELAHCIKELQQTANTYEGNSNAIAFQNGWLRLDKGTFEECAAWRDTLSSMDTVFDVELSKRVQAAIDTGSYEQMLMTECPLMYSFLQDAFPGQVATWLLVMTIIGYSLLTNNPLQVFFNFQGVGGSGKGSLGKVITYLAGKSADHVSFSGMASDTGGLYSCIGKTAVVVDEVDSGLMDRKIKGAAWSKLKMVTGSTPVAVRQLYRNEIKVRLGTKFFLISNEPLQLPDTSGAGERRIISLKFNEPVPVGKQREDIALDVLRVEADTVATIAAGTLRARWSLGRAMFNVVGSKALDEGRAEYLESSAPVRAYLSELVVLDEGGVCVVDGVIACVDAYMSGHQGSQQAAAYLGLSDKKKEDLITAYFKGIGVERDRDSRVQCKGKRYRAFKGVRLDYRKVNVELVTLPDVAAKLGPNMFQNYTTIKRS